MQLHPVRENPLDVIERVGAFRVARHLNLLHGSEILVRRLFRGIQFLSELLEILGNVEAAALGRSHERIDLLLDFHEVSLEFKPRRSGQRRSPVHGELAPPILMGRALGRLHSENSFRNY